MFITIGEVLKRAVDTLPAFSGTLICEAQKGCQKTTKEPCRGILRLVNYNHLRRILISFKLSLFKEKERSGNQTRHL